MSPDDLIEHFNGMRWLHAGAAQACIRRLVDDRERARSALAEARDLVSVNGRDYEQHVRRLAERTLLSMSGLFDED